MNNGHERCVVLVVDDEAVIASTLAMILTSEGYDARSFSDPLEALRAAHFAAPDLLVSDIAMPFLSGFELAAKINSFWPDCKVLLFSGQAAVADRLKACSPQQGRFEILQKPVHPAVLLQRIEELLDLASSPVSPLPIDQNSPPKRPVQSLAALPASPLRHGHPAKDHR